MRPFCHGLEWKTNSLGCLPILNWLLGMCWFLYLSGSEFILISINYNFLFNSPVHFVPQCPWSFCHCYCTSYIYIYINNLVEVTSILKVQFMDIEIRNRSDETWDASFFFKLFPLQILKENKDKKDAEFNERFKHSKSWSSSFSSRYVAFVT